MTIRRGCESLIRDRRPFRCGTPKQSDCNRKRRTFYCAALYNYFVIAVWNDQKWQNRIVRK